jgi:adenosylcobinamide-GDP ribazoletransferase
MLSRELQIFLTALLFFTRIPCSRWVKEPQEYLRDTSRYFPLVGWVVGGVAAVVFWGAHYIWPSAIAVVLSIIASVLLTGALHEDGFIDVCDGFGSGWNKDRILEIMKDSRIGAFGVLGICLLIALKLAALVSLPAQVVPVAFFAGHSLSRFASISLLCTHEYVRHDASSKAKPAVRKMSVAELFFVAVVGIAPLGMSLSFIQLPGQKNTVLVILACLVVVWLVRWGIGRYFFHKIDGYTGDCLGAVQQVTETVFYLTLSAFMV